MLNKKTLISPTSSIFLDSDLNTPERQLEKIVPTDNAKLSNSFDKSSISHESLKDIVQSYIRYYASGQGHTARAKQYDLEHFLKFLARSKGSVDDLLLGDWTLQETTNFVEDRLHRGEAPSTVARRLATIKHLGRTLSDRVSGFVNPAREVKAPVYEVSKPQGLTSDDVIFLRNAAFQLEEANEDIFIHLRNRTILECLLGTGLRADEIRYLKRGQLSEDKSWLKNVKTKGKRFRDVYLHDELAILLNSYLDRCRSEVTIRFPGSLSWSTHDWSQIPVFISTHQASIIRPESFALAPKTLWRIISDLGKKAISLSEEPLPHLHPHKLRHTFAHGLLDSSNDIRLVAQALGHSDVRTTMRYTERSKDELAKAIEKRVSEQRK